MNAVPPKLTRNQEARKAGIPKWLRRYNARYSKAGLDGLLACHLQNPAPMLDNARDRRESRFLIVSPETSIRVLEQDAKELLDGEE